MAYLGIILWFGFVGIVASLRNPWALHHFANLLL